MCPERFVSGAPQSKVFQTHLKFMRANSEKNHRSPKSTFATGNRLINPLTVLKREPPVPFPKHQSGNVPANVIPALHDCKKRTDEACMALLPLRDPFAVAADNLGPDERLSGMLLNGQKGTERS
jgi:hypothetical protein